MTPFLILAAPRSRTAWAAHFLSYLPWHCGHEQLRYARSLDDVKSWLAMPYTGSAETEGMRWWRLALDLCPNLRIITIRRHPELIAHSICQVPLHSHTWFDLTKARKMADRACAKLDQIERRVPGVTRIEFDLLSTEQEARRLWSAAFGADGPLFDPAWFYRLRDLNIQFSMDVILRYYSANQPQLAKFAREAVQASLSALAARRQDRKARRAERSNIIPFRARKT